METGFKEFDGRAGDRVALLCHYEVIDQESNCVSCQLELSVVD